jgi:Recombinase
MRVARKAQAAQFAANVLPIIRDIQAAGHTSLNAIAEQLNARKVATANGGQWRHVQVRQILDRPTNGKRRPKVKRQPWTRRSVILMRSSCSAGILCCRHRRWNAFRHGR